MKSATNSVREGGRMRIAMVSEHASPLAVLGGLDAGGQNVHVAELSAALSRRGHEVLVYTRSDSRRLPERVRTPDGYTVVKVPAGPPEVLSKDVLLQHMSASGGISSSSGATSRRMSPTRTSGWPAWPRCVRRDGGTFLSCRLSTLWGW